MLTAYHIVAQNSPISSTLRNVRMTFWWARERTGNPFLLVMKMPVGTTSALTGSPVHRSISSSDGKSAVNSSTSPIFLLLSHRVRNLFHLQPQHHNTARNSSKYIYVLSWHGTCKAHDGGNYIYIFENKTVCLSLCGHSHSRISWLIFTKIGTDVRTPKRKNEFGRVQYRTIPFPILPPTTTTVLPLLLILY